MGVTEARVSLCYTRVGSVGGAGCASGRCLRMGSGVYGVRVCGGSFGRGLVLAGNIIAFVANRGNSKGAAVTGVLSNGVAARRGAVGVGKVRRRGTGSPFIGILCIPRSLSLVPKAVRRGVLRCSNVGGLGAVGGLLREFGFSGPLSCRVGNCKRGLSNKRGRGLKMSLASKGGMSLVVFSRPAGKFSSLNVGVVDSCVGRRGGRGRVVIVSRSRRLVGGVPGTRVVSVAGRRIWG